jgi:predicted DNA-binding transcriptional regulator AlpA
MRIDVLTEADAARYVNLSSSTLKASRLVRPRCDGPPFIRMGRAVRYRVSDLDAWLTARCVCPSTPTR